MCGIAGIYSFSHSLLDTDLYRLEKMQKGIRHRGPDAEGKFTEGAIGLVHSRFSIIDLSADANQPFFSDDGRFVIIYNGEVFNFQELKEQLVQKNYRFRTNSDTEVILNAYRCWGSTSVKLLNGMFAYVIWDRHDRVLFAARDRYGIKPFYYTVDNEKLTFASECRVLAQTDKSGFTLSEESIWHYLTFGFTPPQVPLWKEIQSLPAGTFLTVCEEKVKIEKYWDFSESEKRNVNISFADMKEMFKEYLINAVKRHLISDVPVGIYLSGGLDSTCLLWACKKLGVDIEAWTLASENSLMNESHLTSRLVNDWGITYHEYMVTSSTYDLYEDEMFNVMDLPQTDFFETFFISKQSKGAIKVALSGAGGDEAFHGYLQRHWLMKQVHPLGNILPQKLLSTMNKINNPLFQSILKFVETAKQHDIVDRLLWTHGLKDDEKIHLFKTAKKYSTQEYVRLYIRSGKQNDIFRLAPYYVNVYLPGHVLAVADTATMHHPIELRVPLLDNELFSWALTLPHSYSFRLGKTKKIIREAMKGEIPEYILNAPKRGFGAPRQHFFRSKKDKVFDTVLKKHGICLKLFSKNYIQSTLEDWYKDERGRKPWGHFQRLNTFYTLSRWYEQQSV